MYEWDERKRAVNRRARYFNWETAVITLDDREDYGELRELAFDFIGVRLHAMVSTRRGGNVRIIRRANRMELNRYVDATKR